MATTVTPHTDRPNIHEMVVVHRAFRREFALLPDLLRDVPDHHATRAAQVAGHLRLILAGLEMHHTGEDEVLWPILIERAAPSTGLVETMQRQHHRIEDYASRIHDLLAPWEARPTRSGGAELAGLVERFAAALVEHLDLEEREILPIVLSHVTVAEWDSMGDHGIEAMTRSQLPLLFGALLEDCDAEERRTMLAKLPVPVRWLLSTIGAAQYGRYVRRVRGR